jgi:hypothetical protein
MRLLLLLVCSNNWRFKRRVMEVQNTFIIKTFSAEQEAALRAFVKALKMKLTTSEKPYNKGFIEKIKASEGQVKAGDFKMIKTEDLWK